MAAKRLAALAAIIGCLYLLPTTTANAAATHPAAKAHASVVYRIPRWHAYLFALSREGDWYVYGGAGPYVFDCSGLVMWAYEQVGIQLPHNTVSMLYSGKLQWIPTSELKPGDLAFFGSGHVELYTGIWGWTYGAQAPGTRVGFHRWNAWWHPTAFYRVIGAG